MLRLHESPPDGIRPAPLDELRSLVAQAKELAHGSVADPCRQALTLAEVGGALRERCSIDDGAQRAIAEQVARLEPRWRRIAAGGPIPAELAPLTEVLAILVRHAALPIAS